MFNSSTPSAFHPSEWAIAGGRADPTYGWLEFDNLELTGTQVADPGVAPEAAKLVFWGVLPLPTVLQT